MQNNSRPLFWHFAPSLQSPIPDPQLDAIMARRGLGDDAVASAIHKLNAVPTSSGEAKAAAAALAAEEERATQAEGAVAQ